MTKISLMVLLSALSTLTVHAQESIESSSYTSEEGHFFSTAIDSISPSMKKLLDEINSEYAKKCGRSMTIGEIKAVTNHSTLYTSTLGLRALKQDENYPLDVSKLNCDVKAMLDMRN